MVILFTPANLETVKQVFPRAVLVSCMVILKAIGELDYPLFYEVVEDKSMSYLLKVKLIEEDPESDTGYQLTYMGKEAVKLFNEDLNEKTLVIQDLGISPAVTPPAYSSLKEAIADVDEWIQEWTDLWPEGVRQVGKLVRADVVTNSDRMKRWMSRYYKRYNKDTILRATKKYLDLMRKDDYKIIRRSYYFIQKTEGGATYSDLASYCDMVLSGKDKNDDDSGMRSVVN